MSEVPVLTDEVCPMTETALAVRTGSFDLASFVGRALEEGRRKHEVVKPGDLRRAVERFGGQLVVFQPGDYVGCNKGFDPRRECPFDTPERRPNVRIADRNLNGRSFGGWTSDENARYLRGVPLVEPNHHLLTCPMWHSDLYRTNRGYVEHRPLDDYRYHPMFGDSRTKEQAYADAMKDRRVWPEFPKKPDVRRPGSVELAGDKVVVSLGIKEGLPPDDDDIAVAIENCGVDKDYRTSRALWYDLVQPYLPQDDSPESDPVSWAAKRLKFVWGWQFCVDGFGASKPQELEKALCEMASRTFNADSSDLVEPRTFEYGTAEKAYIDGVGARLGKKVSPELMVFLLENRGPIQAGSELNEDQTAERCIIPSKDVFPFLRMFDTFVANGLHVDRASALYKTFCSKGVTRPLNKALCIVYYIYSGKVEIDRGEGRMPYKAGEEKPWWFCGNFDLVGTFFDDGIDGVSVEGDELKIGVCDRGVDLVMYLASCGRFATSEAVRLYKSASPSFLRRVGVEDPSDFSRRHVESTALFAGRVARDFSIGNEERGKNIFGLAESMVPFGRGAELINRLLPFLEKQRPDSLVTSMLRGAAHGIKFTGMTEYFANAGVAAGSADSSPFGFFQAVGPFYSGACSCEGSVSFLRAFDSCDNPKPHLLTSTASTALVPASNSSLNLSPLDILDIYADMEKRVGAENLDKVLKVFYASLAHTCHPLMEGLPEAILRILKSHKGTYGEMYNRFAPSGSWGFSWDDKDRTGDSCALIVKNVFGALFSAMRRGIINRVEVEKAMKVVSYKSDKDEKDLWLDEREAQSNDMMDRLVRFGSRYKLLSELEAVGAVSADDLERSCEGRLGAYRKFERYKTPSTAADVCRVNSKFWEHLILFCRLKVVATPFAPGVVDKLLADPSGVKLANSEWGALPRGDIDYAGIFAGCPKVVFDGSEHSVQELLGVLAGKKEEIGCVDNLINRNNHQYRTARLMQFYDSKSPMFGAILLALGPKYTDLIVSSLVHDHLIGWCFKGDFAGVEDFVKAIPAGCHVEVPMLVNTLADSLSKHHGLVGQFLRGADEFNFVDCIAMFGRFGISREAFLLPLCRSVFVRASEKRFADDFANDVAEGKVDPEVSFYRLQIFQVDIQPVVDAVASSNRVAESLLLGKINFDDFDSVFDKFGLPGSRFVTGLSGVAIEVSSDGDVRGRFVNGFIGGKIDLEKSVHNMTRLSVNPLPFAEAALTNYRVGQSYLLGTFNPDYCLSVFEGAGVSSDVVLDKFNKAAARQVGEWSFVDQFTKCLASGKFDLAGSLRRMSDLGVNLQPLAKSIGADSGLVRGYLLGSFDFDGCVAVFGRFGVERRIFVNVIKKAVCDEISGFDFGQRFIDASLDGRVDLELSLRRFRLFGVDPKSFIQSLSVSFTPDRLMVLSASGDRGSRFVKYYFGLMREYGVDTSELERRVDKSLLGFLLTGGGRFLGRVHNQLSYDDPLDSSRGSAGVLVHMVSSVFAARRIAFSDREPLVIPDTAHGVEALSHLLVPSSGFSLQRGGFRRELISAGRLPDLLAQFQADRERHVDLLLQAIRAERVRTVGLLSVGMKLHLYKGHKFSSEFIHRLGNMPGFSMSGGFKLDNADSCFVGTPFPSAGELRVVLQWLGLLELLSSEEGQSAEFQLLGPYELDGEHVPYLTTALLLATGKSLPINAKSFTTAGYDGSLGRIALKTGGAQAFRLPFQTFEQGSHLRTDTVGNVHIGNADIFQLVHTLMVHHQMGGALSGVAQWFIDEMEVALHSYKEVDVMELGDSVDGLEGLDKDAFFGEMRRLQAGCDGGIDFILQGPWIGGDPRDVKSFAHHMICVGMCNASYAKSQDLFDRVVWLVNTAREMIKPYQAGLLVGAGYKYEAGDVVQFANSPDHRIRDLFQAGYSSRDVNEVKALLNILVAERQPADI